MLFGLVVVVFVIVCIFLCLLVLIQSDKGGGISGTLGGGFSGANALLGAQDTANILTKGTTIFAGVYMGLCLLMTVILAFSHRNASEEKSIMKTRAEKQESYSPASVLSNEAIPMATQGEGAMQQPLEATQQPLEPSQSPIPLGDNKTDVKK